MSVGLPPGDVPAVAAHPVLPLAAIAGEVSAAAWTAVWAAPGTRARALDGALSVERRRGPCPPANMRHLIVQDFVFQEAVQVGGPGRLGLAEACAPRAGRRAAHRREAQSSLVVRCTSAGAGPVQEWRVQ